MLLFIILLTILHLIACVVIILLATLHLLRLRPGIYPMVLLVPVFGPISALFLDFHKRHGEGLTDIQVAKFRVEAEIYHSLGFQQDNDSDVVALEEAMIMNSSGQRRNLMMDLVKEHVVPLEEALSISSTDVRRKLMMDVLTSDTSAFYSLLEQARMNDDVEVVHYATTAMAELNKQYDLLMDRCSRRYKETPDDIEVLREYCDCLKQYLELGLVKGQMLRMRREEYIGLCRKLVAQVPELENYADLAHQLILNEDFAEADEILLDMESRWPTNETPWLLRLDYHIYRKDGAAIQEMVRNASYKQIYFSAAAREKIAFWRDRSEGV